MRDESSSHPAGIAGKRVTVSAVEVTAAFAFLSSDGRRITRADVARLLDTLLPHRHGDEQLAKVLLSGSAREDRDIALSTINKLLLSKKHLCEVEWGDVAKALRPPPPLQPSPSRPRLATPGAVRAAGQSLPTQLPPLATPTAARPLSPAAAAPPGPKIAGLPLPPVNDAPSTALSASATGVLPGLAPLRPISAAPATPPAPHSPSTSPPGSAHPRSSSSRPTSTLTASAPRAEENPNTLCTSADLPRLLLAVQDYYIQSASSQLHSRGQGSSAPASGVLTSPHKTLAPAPAKPESSGGGLSPPPRQDVASGNTRAPSTQALNVGNGHQRSGNRGHGRQPVGQLGQENSFLLPDDVAAVLEALDKDLDGLLGLSDWVDMRSFLAADKDLLRLTQSA